MAGAVSERIRPTTREAATKRAAGGAKKPEPAAVKGNRGNVAGFALRRRIAATRDRRSAASRSCTRVAGAAKTARQIAGAASGHRIGGSRGLSLAAGREGLDHSGGAWHQLDQQPARPRDRKLLVGLGCAESRCRSRPPPGEPRLARIAHLASVEPTRPLSSARSSRSKGRRGSAASCAPRASSSGSSGCMRSDLDPLNGPPPIASRADALVDVFAFAL